MIYKNVFDYLISRVNKTLKSQKTKSTPNFIGVLDMAGFEYFEKNSFEQLCINYSNEYMQNYFNENVIIAETELYRSEGVKYIDIKMPDLKSTIDTIETKIFPCLNEQDKLPNGSNSNFYNSLTTIPKSRKQEFIIKHFAGEVAYCPDQFVSKNNDSMPPSLLQIIKMSKHVILKKIEADNLEVGKLRQKTVVTKFKNTLSELLATLNATTAHFVRCIKPNDELKPKVFDEKKVFLQLKFSGIQEAIKVLRQGYPNRINQADLPKMTGFPNYMNKRLLYKALFKMFGGLNSSDYTFGTTKIFFRNGVYHKFDMLVKNLREKNVDKRLVMHDSRFLQHFLFLQENFFRVQPPEKFIAKIKNFRFLYASCV